MSEYKVRPAKIKKTNKTLKEELYLVTSEQLSELQSTAIKYAIALEATSKAAEALGEVLDRCLSKPHLQSKGRN